jgi:hypothetical protein
VDQWDLTQLNYPETLLILDDQLLPDYPLCQYYPGGQAHQCFRLVQMLCYWFQPVQWDPVIQWFHRFLLGLVDQQDQLNPVIQFHQQNQLCLEHLELLTALAVQLLDWLFQ